MATNTPFYISKTSQQGLIENHNRCFDLMNTQWNLRQQMRSIDMAYIREQDYTTDHWRARVSNKLGDSNKIQNVTIPVIKPQVTAAVAYQAGVFLTEYPLFGLVSSAAYEDQALQMQAILEENSIKGAWARELLLFFTDGFKYNLSALEVTWDKITTAAIETDVAYKGGREGRPKEVVWEGNCLKRWDMYNTYFDHRCLPFDIPSRGEFAGHTELMTRTALKSFINTLPTKLIENIVPAFESPSSFSGSSFGNSTKSFYVPQINPDAFLNGQNAQGIDWNAWVNATPGNVGNSIQYRSIYEVSTEYVRILPSDFTLRAPAPNTPQVWKLIIVNHSVIIHAERQTNAHEKIPVFFGCPAEDGLGYQTKPLAEDARPFQQVASALMNATLAGRRRQVNDRMLYDPSRVSEAHINSPNPTAKIPVRPVAFGKNVGDSVYQFPYRDDQAGTNMQEISAVVSFGNVLNGQNAARQGQFVKGNKTDGQWENVMNNATSKDQLTALLYEAQVFTPMKEVLKLNTLQYQGTATIYSPSQKREVIIDPVALRRAVLTFKVTDGLMTSDKIISKDALKAAMQVLGTSQVLASGYNIAPLFSYIMKTENVDLKPYEKSPAQLQYEQASANWSQLAQLAIQKAAPFNIPQPKPQDYGYDPNTVNPSSQVPAQSPTPTLTNTPSGVQ